MPWANGYVDYLKLVNARGGLNGVKLTFEECETAYDTARSVECYERLKSKVPSFVQPLSTGATFAITEKAPVDKIPVVTIGYGRSESADGSVQFTGGEPAEVAVTGVADRCAIRCRFRRHRKTSGGRGR